MFRARSMRSVSLDDTDTNPSVPTFMVMCLSPPHSSMMALIDSPPRPIISPTLDRGTSNASTFGTFAGRSTFPCGTPTCISFKTCSRPTRACSRASDMISLVIPSTLISIWSAVIPVEEPATLKSMSPRASSMPIRSVRIEYLPDSLSRMSPMAIPATTSFSGTPALSIARQPPQTDAMLELPLLSKMLLSTRMTYENWSDSGMTASRALSARKPWPISRRPGGPTRPTSPTENGGKLYWRKKRLDPFASSRDSTRWAFSFPPSVAMESV
mmetsp:Transcript_40515/g.99511  ORF Transcript_40515/g.99511 Transcript_40515/m.99511 type:complete len:270 (+) Transcript_40515:2317-3126(+)